jgi:hypothetical protein
LGFFLKDLMFCWWDFGRISMLKFGHLFSKKRIHVAFGGWPDWEDVRIFRDVVYLFGFFLHFIIWHATFIYVSLFGSYCMIMLHLHARVDLAVGVISMV